MGLTPDAAEPSGWERLLARIPVHPHLIVLRTAATVVLSCLIGQAGFAAAGLGRNPAWFGWHETGAVVTVCACLVSLVLYLLLRRIGGSVLMGLAVATTVMVLVQVGFAEAGWKDVHIFWGVLTVMVGTALTSWTYRHPPPPGWRPATQNP
ncbi:MAG: hypothetical protein ACK5MT_17655 [Actinomycetales bacterium]